MLAWLESERKPLADLDPAYAQVLRRQLEDFAQYDLAEALVNTGDILNPVTLAHASVYGSNRVDFISYDRYRDALAAAIDDPRFSNVRDILQSALSRVDQGGERVVIVPGTSSNVFDQPGSLRRIRSRPPQWMRETRGISPCFSPTTPIRAASASCSHCLGFRPEALK